MCLYLNLLQSFDVGFRQQTQVTIIIAVVSGFGNTGNLT
jgi:hypothetical protein